MLVAGASIPADPPPPPAPGWGGQAGSRSSGPGAAPAPPGLPAAPRCSPLARAAGLQSPPASRSGTRLSRALSQGAGAPPFSPGDFASSPPLPALPTASPSASPNSPARRRLGGCNSRPPRTRAAVPAHAHAHIHTQKPALSRRRTALPGSAQEGQSRPGVGTRRPPPAARPSPALAGPRRRRGYRLGSVTPSGACCRRR